MFAAVEGDAEEIVAVPEELGVLLCGLVPELELFVEHGLAHVSRINLHPAGAGQIEFGPAVEVAGDGAVLALGAQTEDVAGRDTGGAGDGNEDGADVGALAAAVGFRQGADGLAEAAALHAVVAVGVGDGPVIDGTGLSERALLSFHGLFGEGLHFRIVARQVIIGREIGEHVDGHLRAAVLQRAALLVVRVHVEAEGQLRRSGDTAPGGHEIIGAGFGVMVHGLIVIVAGNPDIGDVLVLIGHGIRQVHVGRFGAVGGLKVDVVGDGAGFFGPVSQSGACGTKREAQGEGQKKNLAHTLLLEARRLRGFIPVRGAEPPSPGFVSEHTVLMREALQISDTGNGQRGRALRPHAGPVRTAQGSLPHQDT